MQRTKITKKIDAPKGKFIDPKVDNIYKIDQVSGCEHYKNKCLIECPAYDLCGEGKFYTCQICHDDSKDHELDRFRVKNIKCSECDTVQPK